MRVQDSNYYKIETLKKIKRLLIVVDMVNGFVRTGPMHHKELENIIPENVKLIEDFLTDKEGAVAFVRDCHTPNAQEFKMYPKHCISGTYESELVEELCKYEKDSYTYRKNSTNFVFAPDFIEDINNMVSLEEVVLNGCLTDYCIKNGGIALKNLFDQQDRNIEVVVDQAGVDTYSSVDHNREEANKKALKDMTDNGLILVKNYGEVLWRR